MKIVVRTSDSVHARIKSSLIIFKNKGRNNLTQSIPDEVLGVVSRTDS